MTSAWSQLEQMLTCPICLDKFKNPRLLPCQHSFCGDACMEGLVDYARRQIKCPECRAEHRIPYQGVGSLPSNVTLIRFLELHSRITGEEPEPVPTFLEKCSVCGEKVEGVQRCAHCEKKTCPECKEAHIDLLRREVGRINGQTKRCLSKLPEFQEQLERAKEKLGANYGTVRKEIGESCTRLIEDLEAKRKSFLDQVDAYYEQEIKTLDKLKQAAKEELDILDSNSRLAEDKFATSQDKSSVSDRSTSGTSASSKLQWTDKELWELKEIYARSMEFIRLFDADLGDYTRKIRFILLPEFESIRKRICELGELKFSDSSVNLMASSLQNCNATGIVALELCQQAAAAAQAASQAGSGVGSVGYSLAHSNSNNQLAASVASSSNFLDLPGMQTALIRSQSDHRLASQFQQRLKQQQQQQQDSKIGAYGSSAMRYGARGSGGGASGAAADYETDSLRSRYAPPGRGSGAGDMLTRDWPRPSDTDTTDFGSSIQFKSAFMRRKEKERQQYGNGSSYLNDDDDDLVSEASYGAGSNFGATSRNVRFSEPSGTEQQTTGATISRPRLFDCKELEHAPLSGVPKLEDAPHLLCRLHEMGARAVVDEKEAAEEVKRDKDLIESSRQAMNQQAKRAQRQVSEDEIEKQKRANKQQTQPEQARSSPLNSRPAPETTETEVEPSTPSRPTQPASEEPQASGSSSPATPTGALNRRQLYNQAITEKSKRQLANALQQQQEATASAASNGGYLRRRSNASLEQNPDQQPGTPESSGSRTGSLRRTRLASRSASSKQSSGEVDSSSTGTIQRRRRPLARGDSSQQQSLDLISSGQQEQMTQPKNLLAGSGGSSNRTENRRSSPDRVTGSGSSQAGPRGTSGYALGSNTDQASTTTDDDDDDDDNDDDDDEDDVGKEPDEVTGARATSSLAPMKYSSYFSRRTPTADEDNESDEGATSTSRATTSAASNSRYKSNSRYGKKTSDDSDGHDNSNGDDSHEPSQLDEHDNAASDEENGGSSAASKRLSREFLPRAVNKLLDRSAQIRRDSQEQRSRGDSPQRTSAGGSSNRFGSPGPSARLRYGSSASRSAFASQRSKSQSHQFQDDADQQDSNNSSYTTASSGASINSPSRRRISNQDSSEDQQSGRASTTASSRISGSSTERTLVSRDSTETPRRGYWRDSSADSSSAAASTPSTGFQSRFLSRSRTSAALSSSGGSGSTSGAYRSQDTAPSGASSNQSESASFDRDHAPSTRSYLSSRDRFLQSANAVTSLQSPTSSSSAVSGGSGVGASGNASSTSTSMASNTYSRSGGALAAGQLSGSSLAYTGRYQAPVALPTYNRPQYSDSASPFVELDDEDDQYSAYFPSPADLKGNHHSEYLRNKLEDCRSSSAASATSSTSRVNTADQQQLSTGPRYGSSSDSSDIDDELWKPDRRSTWYHSPSTSEQDEDEGPYRIKGRMIAKIGTRGSQPGQFTWPRGVAIGPASSVIVADSSNHRVQVLDSEGKFKLEFGCYGAGEGQFDCLAGVTYNWVSKNYAVSDRYNHRIQIFDCEGNHKLSFGRLGPASGQLNLPWGIACDPQTGLTYVCDKENHRVQVFNLDGNHVRQFGIKGSQPGQLQHPHYIAVQCGKILVSDTNNHRCQLFSIDGQLIKTFGREGSQPGEFKFPRGVAMDAQGYMIIGDSGNNRLQIFSPSGQFIKSIGTWGSNDGEFKGIEGVAVDTSCDRILVCDRENHRIQIF